MPWSSGDSLNSANLNNMGGAVYSVAGYGATGDGTTDDANSIRKTIAAAATLGGTVYFPSPTSDYRIASTLTVTSRSGLCFRGTGERNSIIRSSSTTADMLVVADCNHMVFSDLRFVGGGGSAGSQRGIVVGESGNTGVTNFNYTFTNVRVTSCNSDGMVLAKPEMTTVRHCQLSNNSGKGLYCHDSGEAKGINLIVENTRCSSNSGDNQVHVNNIADVRFNGVQALTGTPGTSNARIQNMNGFVDTGSDYEFGGAGLQLSGNGFAVFGSLFGSVVTGLYVTGAQQGCVAAIRGISTTSRLLDIGSTSSVAILGELNDNSALSPSINASADVIWPVATPPTAGAALGYQGQIAWAEGSGATYLYVCTSTNSWTRAALEPF